MSASKITVRYSSVDGCSITRQFKTLAGARKFAVYYVGENPDFGLRYAVSSDGVGKVTVDGVSFAELFAVPGLVQNDADDDFRHDGPLS